MTENCFKVIFEGKIEQDRDPEEVKNEICRVFKWSRSKVDDLFSLAPLTIAENVDYQTALKIYAPFRQAGAQCKIFRQEKGITGPQKATDATPSTRPSAPPSPPAGTPSTVMTCPKCGFKQKEGPECIKCGIIIERYIKLMKRQKKTEGTHMETDGIQITEISSPRPGPPPTSPSRKEKTPAHPGSTLHEGLKETADDRKGAQKGLAETRPDAAKGMSPLPGTAPPLKAQKDKLFTYFSNLYQGSREEADDRGARRVIYLLFLFFTLLAFAIPVTAARMGRLITGIEAGALTFLVAAAILLPILRRINRNKVQRVASYFKEKMALEQQQNLSLFLAALILWAEQIPSGDRGRDEIGAACDEIAIAHTPDQEEFTRYLYDLSACEKRSPGESHMPESVATVTGKES